MSGTRCFPPCILNNGSFGMLKASSKLEAIHSSPRSDADGERTDDLLGRLVTETNYEIGTGSGP